MSLGEMFFAECMQNVQGCFFFFFDCHGRDLITVSRGDPGPGSKCGAEKHPETTTATANGTE